jgi:hypothetical protein
MEMHRAAAFNAWRALLSFRARAKQERGASVPTLTLQTGNDPEISKRACQAQGQSRPLPVMRFGLDRSIPNSSTQLS